MKTKYKARVGLYTTGHPSYWTQFAGLKERLLAYGSFIEREMGQTCEVKNFCIVDTVRSGREAGEYFNRENVDIIFIHSATYELSSGVLPVHQTCKAPIVILNLQPCARINYQETSTQEWLSQDSACSIPEFCNVFRRAGLKYNIVSGTLGMAEDVVSSVTDCNTKDMAESQKAWQEIREYISAAMVIRNLRQSSFGLLGNFYCGMLDMYTDLTLFQAVFGTHVEIIEMSDLQKYFATVTESETEEKVRQIYNFFIEDGDSPSDSITKAPTPEQVRWSAKVACAQEKMVRELDLNGLAYYYHGYNDHFEDLQGGFIVGHSLLTAAGVPCAGEGDIKTALAMRICDLLGRGGSFCEIVTTDYLKKAVVIGHDGPFHIDITDEKPIMRGMALYHGKRSSGISVEASVRPGDVTTFAVVQAENGRFKFIASEGTAYQAERMTIGNTETHVDFGVHPDEYYKKWFKAAPTHHFALSVGHNISVVAKIAELLGLELMVV